MPIGRRNLESGKHIPDFNALLDEQRAAVYALRSQVENATNSRETILEVYASRLLTEVLEKFAPEDLGHSGWDLRGLETELKEQFGLNLEAAGIRPLQLGWQALRREILNRLKQEYEAKENILGAETMRYHERMVMVSVIDGLWKEHSEAIDRLAELIESNKNGQEDSSIDPMDLGQRMFKIMMRKFKADSVRFLFRMQILGPDGEQIDTRPARRRADPMSSLHLAGLRNDRDR
jgi:preprotein translocase subunit SecA